MNIKDLTTMEDVVSLNNPSKEVKALIEVANSKGCVVRHVGKWNDTKFGESNIVAIENGQFRISFITNVLKGINYFKIHQVYDYQQDKLYINQRYHFKFISFIGGLNGETFVKITNLN